MKTKKVLTALCGASLATVMTFGALATGCAGSDTGGTALGSEEIVAIQEKYDAQGAVYSYEGDPVTITMSHWTSDGLNQERTVLNTLLEGFNLRYPEITVDVDYIDDYETTYNNNIGTGDLHDVFLVSDGVFTGWATTSGASIMTNLDPYIQSSELVNMDDMFDSVVTRYQYDPATGLTGQGQQMTMPRDISAHVMYYNKDLFEEFGVPLPPSDRVMTMDEATEMWEALTKDLDGDGTPDVYGVGGLSIEGLVWSAGGDFLSDDRTSYPTEQSDIDALTEAFQYLQDAYFTFADGKGICPPGDISQTADATMLFAQQMVATVIAGSWEMMTIQGNSFDWDIAYVPAFEEDPGANAWSGSVSYAIYKNIAPEKLEAAWKLVEYIGCPEGQEILAATGFQFPIYETLANSEDYLAQYTTPEHYEVFLKSAATQPAGTWMYRADDMWRELSYDTYTANLLDTDASARMTVKAFLDACKRQIDSN